jgi:hypothetical protein
MNFFVQLRVGEPRRMWSSFYFQLPLDNSGLREKLMSHVGERGGVSPW